MRSKLSQQYWLIRCYTGNSVINLSESLQVSLRLRGDHHTYKPNYVSAIPSCGCIMWDLDILVQPNLLNSPSYDTNKPKDDTNKPGSVRSKMKRNYYQCHWPKTRPKMTSRKGLYSQLPPHHIELCSMLTLPITNVMLGPGRQVVGDLLWDLTDTKHLTYA